MTCRWISLVGALGYALALGALASCSSVRTDEALAMLDVTASAGMPPFTTARFSVAGLPAIPAHELAYDGRSPLKFGYYLPGPNGVWWAYIVGPLLGGPIGATLYDLLIRATPENQEQAVVYGERIGGWR